MKDKELQEIKANLSVFFSKKPTDLNLTDYYVLQQLVNQLFEIAKGKISE
jgi:hypothetical protein